jgi:acylphosphatase
MDNELTARHVLFMGHVQGVGFRYTAREIADRQGLAGFVRNLPDGAVEMFVQGRADEIALCLEEIAAEFARHIRERRVEQAAVDPRCADFRIAF